MRQEIYVEGTFQAKCETNSKHKKGELSCVLKYF